MKRTATSSDSLSKPYNGAPIDSIKKGRTDLFLLSPQNMVPASINGIKLNTRTDFGDLEGLANSLVTHGCKEVLRGHMNAEGKFEITNGERRWRASMIAESKGHTILLPCRPEPRNYTDEQRILDLFTCNGGKPLTFLEEARTIRFLADRGSNEKEIAEKTGRSTTHIDNCLALLDAGDHILNLVESGKMSATLAIEFIQAEPDVAKQIAYLATAEHNAESAESDHITAKHLPIKVGKARQAELRDLSKQQQSADAVATADREEADRMASLPNDPEHTTSDPFDGKDCTETSPQTNSFGGYVSGVQEKSLAIPFAGVSGRMFYVERPDHQIAIALVFKFPGSFETKRGIFERVTEESPLFSDLDHAHLNALTRMHEEIVLAREACIDDSKETRTRKQFMGITAWFEEEISELAAKLGTEVHLPESPKSEATAPWDSSEPEVNPVKSLTDLLGSLVEQDCVKDRRRTFIVILSHLKKVENSCAGDILISTLEFGMNLFNERSAEKVAERVRTLSYVISFLNEKNHRENVAKYLLGVID